MSRPEWMTRWVERIVADPSTITEHAKHWNGLYWLCDKANCSNPDHGFPSNELVGKTAEELYQIIETNNAIAMIRYDCEP